MNIETIKALDRFLSEASEKSKYVIMNPLVWNGYWTIKYRNRFFRWLGRKLKSKYIYWIGFQLHWEQGLKDLPEFFDFIEDNVGSELMIAERK
jgi:hypothetical protein